MEKVIVTLVGQALTQHYLWWPAFWVTWLVFSSMVTLPFPPCFCSCLVLTWVRLQWTQSSCLYCFTVDLCSSSLCVNPFKESTPILFGTSASNRPPHQCHQWSCTSYCCPGQPSRTVWHLLPSVLWSRQLCSGLELSIKGMAQWLMHWEPLGSFLLAGNANPLQYPLQRSFLEKRKKHNKLLLEQDNHSSVILESIYYLTQSLLVYWNVHWNKKAVTCNALLWFWMCIFPFFIWAMVTDVNDDICV